MRPVEIVGAMVALIGAARLATVELRDVRSHPIDERYAGLAERIPLHATVGYIAEEGLETLEGQRRFSQASYSLAPRLVLPDDGATALVLVDLDHAAQTKAHAASAAMTVVLTLPSGVALLERSQPSTAHPANR